MSKKYNQTEFSSKFEEKIYKLKKRAKSRNRRGASSDSINHIADTVSKNALISESDDVTGAPVSLMLNKKKLPINVSEEKVTYNRTPVESNEIVTKGYVDDNPPSTFGSVTFTNDITVNGRIILENSEVFHNETDNAITMNAPTLWLNASSDHGSDVCGLILMSASDTQIRFYRDVGIEWSIGNDADDSDKFKWDVGMDVGSATKMTLTSAGELTVADDVLDDGNDPTVDAQLTNKQYVDAQVSAENVVKHIEVTISQAEMNALHTTEKVLVAAQGSGKVIIPLRVTAFIDRAATQLNAVTLWYNWAGITSIGAWGYQKRIMRSVTTDRIETVFSPDGVISTLGLDLIDNDPFTCKLDGATTTDWLTSMKLSIAYYVYDNS